MHSPVLEEADTLLAPAPRKPVTTPVHAHPVDDHSHDDGAKTTMGFWIYLMSDCLIFAVLFATFGVLMNQTADGPGGRDLFELPFVLGETMLLLISSFTFGVAMLNVQAGKQSQVVLWLMLNSAIGAGFIGMEVFEFSKLIYDARQHIG